MSEQVVLGKTTNVLTLMVNLMNEEILPGLRRTLRGRGFEGVLWGDMCVSETQ